MTLAQTLNHSDKDDAQRLEWLREHGEQIGTQNGTTTWRMADGSRMQRTAVMGAACYGTLPAAKGDIVEKRRETVPASCTLNERDAVIVTVEGPRVTRYRVQCRSASTTEDGSRYMDTQHTAWFTAYLKAYDAAEAWAYRGEIPKGDCC